MIDYKESNKLRMNYAVIDSGSLIYSAVNPNKVLDDTGNPVKVDGKFQYYDKTLIEAQYHLDNILIQMFQTLDIGHFIGFIDTRFDLNFRVKIDSRYKSNRKDREPPKWIREIKQHLQEYWKFIPVQVIESDDACSICKNHYKELNPILISGDHDCLNLEGVTYNGRNGTLKVNTLEDEQRELWLSLLVGDASDFIGGVSKIGLVKATKLLEGIEGNDNLREVVLKEYCKVYNENKGIELFYKTYSSLYTLRSIDELPIECDFKVPEFVQTPGTF